MTDSTPVTDPFVPDSPAWMEALAYCVQEPIHMPGAVQPFGLLLAWDRSERVQHAAGLVPPGCPFSPADLLGQPLEECLPGDWLATWRERLNGLPENRPLYLPGPVWAAAPPLASPVWPAVVHRRCPLHFLELLQPGLPLAEEDCTQALHELIAAGQDFDSIRAFAQHLVTRLRTVSGYDRVHVYQFEPQGHGQVIAEAHAAALEPFLGLHYPASDIPAQARELYRLHRLRVLVDAQAESLPLHSLEGAAVPVDLSMAVLRPLAAVHREYLGNMGVRATLVASILHQGQLWGLLTCHHCTPRSPCVRLRRLMESLAHLLELHTQRCHDRQRQQARVQAQSLLESLSQSLQDKRDFQQQVLDPSTGWMEMVQATGLAIYYQGRCYSRGFVPSESEIVQLIAWLRQRGERFFATDCLGSEAPAFASLASVACGVLALACTPEKDDWLLWFRPEWPATVQWAGDPRKGLVVREGVARLTPRTSFTQWLQEVRGRACPWQDHEIALIQEVVQPSLIELILADSLRRNRETQRNLSLILEQMPLGCLIHDLQGRIVTWNPTCEQIFGWTAAEIIGQSIYDTIVPEEASDYVRDLIHQLASQRCSIHGHNRNRTREGKLIWCRWNNSPLLNTKGELVGFLSMAQDETDLHEARLALEESTQRYEMLVNTMQDAVSLHRPNGQMIFVTPSTQKITGFSPEEWLAMDTLSLIHPEDRPRTHEVHLRNLAGEVTKIEWRCRSKQGNYVWLETITTPSFDEKGQILSLVCCSRDISDRKKAEAARQALEEQLRQSQKLEAIGQLAGGVAHDFNNLLTVIVNCAELLLQACSPQHPDRPLLQDILHAAERGATLTRQLLTFSRQQIVHKQVIDLNPLVENICGLLSRLLGEHITLRVQTVLPSPYVEADRGQIEQILMNLLVNARDAMPQGGTLLIRCETVEVTADTPQRPLHCPPGSYARLTVQDTGVGMTPEVRARLFEPFFTTKPVGQGTGLGLATVHGIVTQSQGFLAVTSELGQGSTFEVYLPRVTPPVQGSASSCAASPQSILGKRILLVEDDPDVRQLSATILSRAGFEVVLAETPHAALELVAQLPTPPDLLLTDVVMPGMSGRQLMEQLKRRLPGLRVGFVSGYHSDVVLRHGIEADNVAFLQKPFGPDALLRFVQQILQPG